MGTATITFLTANINQYMPQAHIDHDIKRLAAFAKEIGADFVAGAEIMSEESYRLWAKEFEALGYDVYGNGPRPKENPLAVKRRVDITAHGVKLLSVGEAALSPNRYVTWVRAAIKDILLEVEATHLVSQFQKSTAGRIRTRIRLFKEERKKIRERHDHSIKVGRFIVILGDMNAPAKRLDWRRLRDRVLRKQVELVPFAGGPLQKMMCISAIFARRDYAVKVLKHGEHSADLFTDHPFRWSTVEITAK